MRNASLDTRAILSEVADERVRQDERWGEQNHTPDRWLTILVEEVGEVARAIYEDHAVEEIGSELIQVAAVAVAFVESLNRNATGGES